MTTTPMSATERILYRALVDRHPGDDFAAQTEARYLAALLPSYEPAQTPAGYRVYLHDCGRLRTAPRPPEDGRCGTACGYETGDDPTSWTVLYEREEAA